MAKKKTYTIRRCFIMEMKWDITASSESEALAALDDDRLTPTDEASETIIKSGLEGEYADLAEEWHQ